MINNWAWIHVEIERGHDASYSAVRFFVGTAQVKSENKSGVL